MGKTISEKAVDLLRKRFKFLGVVNEEAEATPAQKPDHVRHNKSPAGRNMNSSIGKSSQFGGTSRKKTASTITPRKSHQFGMKSEMQKSPAPIEAPIEQPQHSPEDISLDQEEELTEEPEIPDGNPHIPEYTIQEEDENLDELGKNIK